MSELRAWTAVFGSSAEEAVGCIATLSNMVSYSWNACSGKIAFRTPTFGARANQIFRSWAIGCQSNEGEERSVSYRCRTFLGLSCYIYVRVKWASMTNILIKEGTIAR